MLEHNVVMNSKVSGCFIRHMDIVSLMDKADKCTAHGNHVIIRVRREDQHRLRERLRGNRSLAVICIRLSARPSCDSMLKVIEYVNVDLVERSELVEQLTERMLQIISLLVHFLAKPYYSLSDEFSCPLARAYKPRRYYSCQERACILIYIAADVRMSLEQ